MTDTDLLQEVTSGVIVKLGEGGNSPSPDLTARVTQAVYAEIQGMQAPTAEQKAAVIAQHVKMATLYGASERAEELQAVPTAARLPTSPRLAPPKRPGQRPPGDRPVETTRPVAVEMTAKEHKKQILVGIVIIGVGGGG